MNFNVSYFPVRHFPVRYFSVMRKFIYSFLTFISILAFHLSSNAQQIAKANGGISTGDTSAAQYNYLFENPRFTTPVQEVKFDGDGKGEYRFKRKDQDEIVLHLNLSSALVSQVRALFDELNFLAGNENYQHKKDFSHLGTMTITCSRDNRERTIKFNYTENQTLNRLAEIFRGIATQETRIFELEAIRANDPISTPAQLRLLESELKGRHIADPERFTPILREIKLDEGVPLIARNHADRLLLAIRKGK